MSGLGPIGRLGRWTANHRRAVAIAWLIVAVGFGMLAPRAEHALSGAGWEASGSESVRARQVIQKNFAGNSSAALVVVVHSDARTVRDPRFRQAIARVEAVLGRNDAIASVTPPRPGFSISRDGHTALVQAGAAKDTNSMVDAATDLKEHLARLGNGGMEVNLTGASGMWSDFNDANKEAMLKSEVLSWPVTMAILIVAFGALVAAGLPLMLTITALIASAGLLFIGTRIADISIWSMNFALMFSLALGIDYALFILMRFRAALLGQGLRPIEAVASAMDTAGKAVLFSAVTVLISLSAVMLVPSPAFRSMALGIMLSVVFVLAAALTLLPAVLAKLGPRVNRVALPWVHAGEHASRRFTAWGERLWRHPWAFGAAAVTALVLLALPVLKLDTGMPSIGVIPKGDHSRRGYDQVQAAFGKGAPGALQLAVPAREAGAVARQVARDPGIAQVLPPERSRSGDLALVRVVPREDPSSESVGKTVDRLRSSLPEGTLVGGAPAENHDLEAALGDRTALAIAAVLALGFLLLLVALQAPLIAALGVVTNLLATGAAFGIAKWIFQDGNLAGFLGFESQGFVDAWAPIFFFAMVFAISMDYTVFLLSSAKEHWDRSHNARDAALGGLAHSGRVVLAAAAVMVAIFFTFALSGPLPPKEMGVILGVAVLLDAALVRLLLIPVLLRLCGRAAWWLPRWLDRLLPEVRFGHATPARAEGRAGSP
jgi:RND superfamily putative drug exporter